MGRTNPQTQTQTQTVFDFDDVGATDDDGRDFDVFVTETFTNSYGDERAVLDGRTYDAKEIIKFDWEQTHHKYDGDRKTWIVDADALDALAEKLDEHGFALDTKIPDDDSDQSEPADPTLREFAEAVDQGDEIRVTYEKKNGAGLAENSGAVTFSETDISRRPIAVVFHHDEKSRSVKADDSGVTSLFSSGYHPYMGRVVEIEIVDTDDDTDADADAQDDDADVWVVEHRDAETDDLVKSVECTEHQAQVVCEALHSFDEGYPVVIPPESDTDADADAQDDQDDDTDAVEEGDTIVFDVGDGETTGRVTAVYPPGVVVECAEFDDDLVVWRGEIIHHDADAPDSDEDDENDELVADGGKDIDETHGPEKIADRLARVDEGDTVHLRVWDDDVTNSLLTFHAIAGDVIVDEDDDPASQSYGTVMRTVFMRPTGPDQVDPDNPIFGDVRGGAPSDEISIDGFAYSVREDDPSPPVPVTAQVWDGIIDYHPVELGVAAEVGVISDDDADDEFNPKAMGDDTDDEFNPVAMGDDDADDGDIPFLIDEAHHLLPTSAKADDMTVRVDGEEITPITVIEDACQDGDEDDEDDDGFDCVTDGGEDVDGGEDDQMRNATVERDRFPSEIYARHTDYVTLGMKTMTAKRMINWLREYADFCDIAGNTKSGDDARAVANRLAYEVEPESVTPAPNSDDGGADDDDPDRDGELVTDGGTDGGAERGSTGWGVRDAVADLFRWGRNHVSGGDADGDQDDEIEYRPHSSADYDDMDYVDERGIRIFDTDWTCPNCGDAGELMFRPGSKNTCATCFWVLNGRYNDYILGNWPLKYRHARRLLASLGDTWHGTPGSVGTALRKHYDSPREAEQAFVDLADQDDRTPRLDDGTDAADSIVEISGELHADLLGVLSIAESAGVDGAEDVHTRLSEVRKRDLRKRDDQNRDGDPVTGGDTPSNDCNR